MRQNSILPSRPRLLPPQNSMGILMMAGGDPSLVDFSVA